MEKVTTFEQRNMKGSGRGGGMGGRERVKMFGGIGGGVEMYDK